MNNTLFNIKVIIGSIREGRFGDKPAAWISEQIKKQEGIAVEILDLADYNMPFFNESVSPAYKQEPYKNEAVSRFTKKIAEADAFVIVTPEYNRGTSAVLKNALDWIYPEWNNKPVAFVAYGGVGGARAVEQLRLNAIELQMAPIRQSVNISAHWLLLDEKGNLKPGSLDQYEKPAEIMIDQLLWWTRALKTAR